jgi:hypothetical protein
MSKIKDRVEQALLRHHEKLAKTKIRKSRNGRPEKDVERDVLAWMRDRGWDAQVIEAKATYNPRAGRYLRNSSVAAGTCDIIGTDPNGTFVAVELKAPGRLSTFAADRNEAQRDYLIAKIRSGAFAAVTDCTSRLEQIYEEYLTARAISPEKSKQLLLSYLPKKSP